MLVFLVSDLSAQVKVEREVNEGSKMGKTKLLKEAPKEIYLAQFAVWFKTSRGDSETTNAITSRSEWDLGEEDALAVVDMARAYCRSNLKVSDTLSKQMQLRKLRTQRRTKSSSRKVAELL